MKPKEKAKELFNKMSYNDFDEDHNCSHYVAKNCSLIAIDEVKWFHKRLFYLTEGSLFDKYLDEVKQEIEKL